MYSNEKGKNEFVLYQNGVWYIIFFFVGARDGHLVKQELFILNYKKKKQI